MALVVLMPLLLPLLLQTPAVALVVLLPLLLQTPAMALVVLLPLVRLVALVVLLVGQTDAQPAAATTAYGHTSRWIDCPDYRRVWPNFKPSLAGCARGGLVGLTRIGRFSPEVNGNPLSSSFPRTSGNDRESTSSRPGQPGPSPRSEP